MQLGYLPYITPPLCNYKEHTYAATLHDTRRHPYIGINYHCASTATMPPTRPIILIATDTPTFDIEPWASEGYSIHLLTYATARDIEDAADDLESNDKYGIIGRPSSHSYFPPPLISDNSVRRRRHRRSPIRDLPFATASMCIRILPAQAATHQLPTRCPGPVAPALGLSILGA